MTHIDLASDELQWLVDTLGQFVEWPPHGAEWVQAYLPPDSEATEAGGPMFRLRLLRLYLQDSAPEPVRFECSIPDLWMLDAVLGQFETRYSLTTGRGMGRPLNELHRKVMAALVAAYDSAPDSGLLGEIDRLLKGDQ